MGLAAAFLADRVGEPGPASEVDIPETAEAPAVPAGVGFTAATDTVLVFIDHTGGFVAVDLDTGQRTRLDLPESVSEGAGRTIQRMMGGYLVASGSQQVRAISLSTGIPTLLADGASALPSRHAGVWTVGPGSESAGTVWKFVNPLGAAVHETSAEPGYNPVHGVTEGLALQDGDGRLYVYDPTLDEIADYLADDPAHIADASAGLVAWCLAGCQQMHIHRASDDQQLVLGDERLVRWNPETTWLSDDGRWLAARVGVEVGQDALSVELHVYNTDTGELLDRSQIPFAPMHGNWTPDSTQFYYWIHDPNATGGRVPTELGRYTPDDGLESIDLDPQGAVLGDFVALPADAFQAPVLREVRPPDTFGDAGTQWVGTLDGTRWSVTASYDDVNDHICFERSAGDHARGSCKPPVSQALLLDVVGTAGNLPVRVVAGQVARDVIEVRVKMSDGEVVPIETRELPGTDHRVFAVAFADDEEPQIIEAENGEGGARSFGL